MGDDRDEGRPPVPEGRAPWERYFSDSDEPPSHSAHGRSAGGNKGGGLWPFGSKSDKADKPQAPEPKSDKRLTVSDLVDKVDKEERGESETEQIPAITDAPLSEQDPTARVMPPRAGGPPQTPPPPPAQPMAVAPAPMTRLALSKQRRHRRMRLAGRSTAAMFAVLALLLTGVVWGYLRSADNGFAQVAALDENSTDVVDAGGQTGDETYLIVGTDNRAGKNGSLGVGNAVDVEGARSDTVMLVNIPANRKRVVAVSFPRDLDVTRPVCRGWDNNAGTYTNETYPAADGDKLNATYALGGPKCLVKVIQKMSGLKIGHFVGMDFSGFETMVNEVGGVQVCTPYPLIDGELGPVLTKTGKQEINGATALNYVRARNIAAEGNGDYGRIKRQQRFLSSLLRSALSDKVLLDPGKLNGFISAFTKETFVQNVTTKDLVMLGRSLQNVDAGAVTFLTVPTAGTTDYGNEIPRLDDITAIFKAIIDDDPLPGEERKAESTSSSSKPATTAKPAPPVEAIDPSAISLQVSNASGVDGVAANAASNLGNYGYQIYSVGNYTTTSDKTVVRYSEGQEAQAQTVASSIPGATVESASGLGSIVELVLGSDFTGTVNEPPSAGTGVKPVPGTPSTDSGPPAELPPDLSVTNAADDSCS